MKQLAGRVEATRPEALKDLLYELKPGLKKVGWSERQQYELQWLKSAPERFRKIQADLDRYKEMKLSGSASEFSAAIAGQVVGSMLSPESYIGWQVKGASWLVRGLKAALQQAGIAGVADLATQANLIQAGEQDKVDGWRTTGAVASGVVSGVAMARAKPKSEHVGITPEVPPKQPTPDVNVDGSAPVATRSDATEVVTADVSAPQLPKSEDPVSAVSTSSEAKAAVPQEAPPASQVPGEQGLGPNAAPGQQALVPEGTPKQEQPLGMRGDEPAPVAPGAEAAALKDETHRVVVEGDKQAAIGSEPKAAGVLLNWAPIDLEKHDKGKAFHAFQKHVEKPIEFLRKRLFDENHIRAASTYTSRA